jgi:hypothetical protein
LVLEKFRYGIEDVAAGAETVAFGKIDEVGD